MCVCACVWLYSGERDKKKTPWCISKPHILSFWSSFSDKIIRNGYREKIDITQCTHTHKHKLNWKETLGNLSFSPVSICALCFFSLIFTKGHELTCTTTIATTTTTTTMMGARKKEYGLNKYYCHGSISTEEKENKIKKYRTRLTKTRSFHNNFFTFFFSVTHINCKRTFIYVRRELYCPLTNSTFHSVQNFSCCCCRRIVSLLALTVPLFLHNATTTKKKERKKNPLNIYTHNLS